MLVSKGSRWDKWGSLTFVLGIFDHFGDHGLHDGDIAVQGTSNEARKQGDPVCLSHTKHDAAQSYAGQANEGDGLPAIDVGDSAPTQSSDGFSNGVGGQEQTRVESSIFVRNAQVLGHDVGVGQNGVEGERLGKSAYSCGRVSKRGFLVSAAERTDDDELLHGKGSIFGVYRRSHDQLRFLHALKSKIATRVKEREGAIRVLSVGLSQSRTVDWTGDC